MDITKLVETLHPLERAVVPHLTKETTLSGLVDGSKLQEVEVMRALQWLANKGVLKIISSAEETVGLDINGERYLKEGMPEKKFLKILTAPKTLQEIRIEADLCEDEFKAAIGILRGKAAIEFEDAKVKITDNGRKLLAGETFEEIFLKKAQKRLYTRDLSPEDRFAFQNLRRRKAILLVRPVKVVSFELTALGKKLAVRKIEGNVVDRLTPALLASRGWKNKKFRRYDVTINVPHIYFGRRHHYRSFLDFVRWKFASLGFKEMTGPLVETDFWDMDALFMPQFHSARDIHEAYYVKEPGYGRVDAKILASVKKIHEDGGNTGSKGWCYKFDVNRTKRLLLRTQGTACSARTLASKNLEIPGKYFGIAKCFRYDIIDATHLPDFFQTEGIVVGEGLNMSHLKGLLKLFAKEFAKCEEVKIRPAYFPFTEPSCELFAKHPDLGWIELGGAGILRPEVTSPLGVDVPVIAWGMGIDRIGMFNIGIGDIRNLYSHNLDFLKSVRMI